MTIATLTHAAGLGVTVAGDDVVLPARTILVAAGTQPNTVLAREEPDWAVLDGRHFRALDEDGNPAVLRHLLAHTAIRIEGNRAWTRAQWFEMANDGPGKSLKMGTFGIYEDQLRKVDGRWLFSERRILNDFLPGRESGPGNPIRSLDEMAAA